MHAQRKLPSCRQYLPLLLQDPLCRLFENARAEELAEHRGTTLASRCHVPDSEWISTVPNPAPCDPSRLQMFSCLRDAFGPMNSAFVAPEPKKKAHGDEHKKKQVMVWSSYQVLFCCTLLATQRSEPAEHVQSHTAATDPACPHRLPEDHLGKASRFVFFGGLHGSFAARASGF